MLMIVRCSLNLLFFLLNNMSLRSELSLRAIRGLMTQMIAFKTSNARLRGSNKNTLPLLNHVLSRIECGSGHSV